MYHQHFEQCQSTQSYIKENWKELSKKDQKVLISTDKQTAGVGRRGTGWNNYEYALAFSMTLAPSPEFSLTSLELGILICEFYSRRVVLKWPNDLITSDIKKCGGIICNVIDSKTIIAGIGLNLFLNEEQDHDFKIPPGGIYSNIPEIENFKEELPKALATFIHENRLTNKEILEKFNSYCVHMDKKVKIVDTIEETSGFFKGVNENGSAILETESGIKNVMSGSLFLE